MLWRVGVFAALFASLLYGDAGAKGLDGFVGATVSGTGVAQPIEVSISLPEDDYGWTHWGYDPHPSAAELSYQIVLHFDFKGESPGCYSPTSGACPSIGEQDGAGNFDGTDILYFPNDLRIGNGTWSAGWYRASPELARQLQAGLRSWLAAPNTGDGGLLDSAGGAP